MVVTPLVLLLAVAQRPSNQYTLSYLDEGFVVRKGAKTETVALRSPVKPKTALSFRTDKRWAVWDARGLTTRDGEWNATDRLEFVATSPRVQDREAIRKTLAEVKAGRRRLAASGLSGARRIGSQAYFLVRWDEKGGEPWLEALVSVDLSKAHPKPRFIGAFPGHSLGRGLIDDRMGIQGGRLTVAVNGDETWGFASFDPVKGVFGYEERGRKLVDLDGYRVIEKTAYGSLVVGRRQGEDLEPWAELRGSAEFVPGEGAPLVQSGSQLRNVESGAEFRLPRNAAIRRAKAGILVFWPEKSPRSARLLDEERLEEIARWERGTRASEGRRKP